jgi:hypothetical protein
LVLDVNLHDTWHILEAARRLLLYVSALPQGREAPRDHTLVDAVAQLALCVAASFSVRWAARSSPQAGSR